MADTSEKHTGLILTRHKKAVLVKGDTMLAKELLKSIGGSWNKALGGWIFAQSKHTNLVNGLKQANIEFTDDFGSTPEPGQPSSAPSPGTAPASNIVVEGYKKAILCHGDTMSVKTMLKDVGGRWNPSLKGWIFAPNRHAELVKQLSSSGKEFVDKYEPAVETGKRPRDEADDADTPPTKVAKVSELTKDEQDGIVLERYKKAILVRGNTMAVKDSVLKPIGGKWNSALKGWIFSQNKHADLVAGIKKADVSLLDKFDNGE